MKTINYIEYVYDTINIGADAFAYIFEKYSTIDKNYFKKQYIKYILNDLVYEYSNSPKKYINTYRLTPIGCITNDDQYVKLMYCKEKIPYYLFPSTNKLTETLYINNMIFRIHNNVYLNFEMSKSNKQQYYKIYINYNATEMVDQSIVDNCISKIKNDIIKSAFEWESTC